MGGETTSIMCQNPVEEGYSGMRGETTTMMYQNPVEEELGRDACRDYNYDVPINDGPSICCTIKCNDTQQQGRSTVKLRQQGVASEEGTAWKMKCLTPRFNKKKRGHNPLPLCFVLMSTRRPVAMVNLGRGLLLLACDSHTSSWPSRPRPHTDPIDIAPSVGRYSTLNYRDDGI